MQDQQLSQLLTDYIHGMASDTKENLVNRLFAILEDEPEYSHTPGQTNLHKLNNYTLAVLIAILESWQQQLDIATTRRY